MRSDVGRSPVYWALLDCFNPYRNSVLNRGREYINISFGPKGILVWQATSLSQLDPLPDWL